MHKVNKSKAKKRNRYNHPAISAVASTFGISKDYVRQILRGDRTPVKLEDQVKSLYKKKKKQIEAIINQ